MLHTHILLYLAILLSRWGRYKPINPLSVSMVFLSVFFNKDAEGDRKASSDAGQAQLSTRQTGCIAKKHD